MDQHNQKSLLPDFSTNGFSGQFNGLPHGNANSIMSTLQSLQMQSMGNQILPQSDLHCDLQNQLLLEQLTAMQSMYNTINVTQKIDPKFSQIPQSNLTIQNFNTMTGDPSTSNLSQNNIYSSLPSTSGLQNAVSQHAISATHLPNLALQSSFILDNNLGTSLNMKLPQTTLPQAQAAVEDWMKNICVDSLLDPFKTKSLAASSSTMMPLNTSISIPTATLADNAFQIAASSFLQHPLESTSSVITSTVQAPVHKDPSPEIIDVTETSPVKFVVPEPIPSTSSALEKPLNTSTSGLDYDEAHDDVDNIFGLSLAEDDVTAGSMYRRQSSTDKGLSPIAFTPPDSPQNELTFDELFGFTTEVKKEESSPFEPNPDTTTTEGPSTSSENFRISNSTTISSAVKDEEDEFVANFVRPKNVPVYKQKAALMSLEAREAAKKEDPNYDAFEFEDDDDEFMFGEKSMEVKKEFDTPKKMEQPKTKSVYITGVGFEIQGKEHMKRWQPRQHPAPPVNNDNFNDKVFFTIADKIRTRRDEETTSWFMKPEQSHGTECAKNIRKFTKEEPLLPKFIIRIDHLQSHCDEPMITRKRYKRKKNKLSGDEDSDYDDVSYINRRRKITKKVYSLHQETDPNFRRTVLGFDAGPCVTEANRKRVSAFGPAEGLLPKGTYVVCKSDMLRDDCAVWRVDNQNLLQKFPQMRNPKTNKLVYRSSSTYSGWCEQISSQYFRVSVRIIKQTRSETTVEPEIPLAELFCASSIEWFKHPGTFFVKVSKPKKKPEELPEGEEQQAEEQLEVEPEKEPEEKIEEATEEMTLEVPEEGQEVKPEEQSGENPEEEPEVKQEEIPEPKPEGEEEIEDEEEEEEEEDLPETEPKVVALREILNVCLTQVFTKKHVETLLDRKDWTYTRSVTELEKHNKHCEELIKKRIPVRLKHERWIGSYTRLAVSKSSFTSLTKCQICKRKKPRRVIHFFDKSSYNVNLVVDELEKDLRDENLQDRKLPIVADAISCGRCSMAVDILHKMHHLQFHMLRLCEDKLEEIGTKEIDLPTEKIIDAAKADESWMKSVLRRYCNLWDQARYEFRDV